MSHVQFPNFVIRTEFSTLSQKLFNLPVILTVPIYFTLGHQHWNIFFKLLIKFLQWFFNSFIIPLQSAVLNALCDFSQTINMSVWKVFKFPVSFLRTSLTQNQCVNIIEVLLWNALVSEINVFSEDIGCHIEILVFAVEKEDIGERLGGKGRVLQQPSELLKPILRVVFHVH